MELGPLSRSEREHSAFQHSLDHHSALAEALLRRLSIPHVGQNVHGVRWGLRLVIDSVKQGLPGERDCWRRHGWRIRMVKLGWIPLIPYSQYEK
jgi:hypothetical protein